MADLASPGTVPAAAPAEGPIPTPGGPLSYIHWGPVSAGAIAAAAVWFVLMTFASAVGLATLSPSPTWRDTSIALALLSGVWLLLVALGSFGLGGYLAGRVRSSWATSEDEVEFRDGAHGLLVWALAVVIGAVLTWATATALTSVSAGTTTVMRPTQGEPAFLAYELDRLFRSDRRPERADPEARAEAGRIIMTGVGRRDIGAEDRAYLVRLVTARTGLAPADAERRVSEVVAQARQAARRARASSVVIGFMTAASLAVGAAAAWFAAGIGGRHRDRAISPPLRWSWRRRP
ncbi:MAG: hypothetical protein ACJ8FU_20615 [Xanthobacteraceae bacterium]|jgi:hypothetical protein